LDFKLSGRTKTKIAAAIAIGKQINKIARKVVKLKCFIVNSPNPAQLEDTIQAENSTILLFISF